MIVVIIIVVILNRAFDAAYPCGGRCYRVIVEQSGIHDLGQVDVREVALQDTGLRLKGPDDLADLAQLVLGHFRDLVQYDEVAELHLLDDEVLDIVLIEIAAEQVLGACELIAHAQYIHHGSYAVEAGHAVLDILLAHVGDRTYGAGNGLRLADAARLDDDVVELLHRDDVPELLHQVHLERTADTAVLQRHEAVVTLAHHTVFLYEVGVNVHFADVVYDDGELYTLAVGKYPVDESRLSASEISGEQQYWSFIHIH